MAAGQGLGVALPLPLRLATPLALPEGVAQGCAEAEACANEALAQMLGVAQALTLSETLVDALGDGVRVVESLALAQPLALVLGSEGVAWALPLSRVLALTLSLAVTQPLTAVVCEAVLAAVEVALPHCDAV